MNRDDCSGELIATVKMLWRNIVKDVVHVLAGKSFNPTVLVPAVLPATADDESVEAVLCWRRCCCC